MLYVKYASSENLKSIFDNSPFFSILFDDAPDAVFIIDSKTYSIIECNSKALELFEAESKTQLINQPSFRLYESEPVEFSRNLIEMNIRNAGEHTQEMAFRTLKQNVFWGKLKKRLFILDKEELLVLRICKAVDYLRAEEVLSTLLRGTAKVTGNLFFKELVKLLCRTFDVKYAFVGKLTSNKKTLSVIEMYGPLTDDALHSYKVNNTMIENVLRGYTTFYPSGVKDLFPEDIFAQGNSIEGFMGTPVYGGSGDVIGIVAFMHDKAIQEIPNSRYILSIFASRTAAEIQRIRSKEILKEQTRDLATANAVKDKLLSVISNDLQSPLHNVLEFSKLLREKIQSYPKEKITEKVEIIDNSIRNIYFILENLSDWSRIYLQKIRLSSEKINLVEIVNENLNLFHCITEIKEHNIHVSLNDCPAIIADKHMINTIIRNILSNAIKYTAQGRDIFIRYEESATAVLLKIKDTGTGMSAKEVKQILDANSNIPDLNFINKNATGLGLILSKNFIERLNGSLNIISEPDCGTEIILTFLKTGKK